MSEKETSKNHNLYVSKLTLVLSAYDVHILNTRDEVTKKKVVLNDFNIEAELSNRNCQTLYDLLKNWTNVVLTLSCIAKRTDFVSFRVRILHDIIPGVE